LGYEHAIKIVSVTQGIKKCLMEMYNVPDERIIVIGNGANIEQFKPMDQEETKKELKLDQDADYVCFVGSLFPWHGIQYLVDAAPSILRACPNTRFLIVGEGSMKNEWMQQAKELGVYDQFRFTGSVRYEKVPLYINASEICIATFTKERHMKIGGSPLKMFEYMACEKPVVSSRIPDIDFIEKENAGLLVEPENPQELAKAIITLMKNEKLRETMGKNARKYVSENHSWEAVARKVAEIFKDSPTSSSCSQKTI
jgi:glycosyltransferase involved in cell wall biosynthesis